MNKLGVSKIKPTFSFYPTDLEGYLYPLLTQQVNNDYKEKLYKEKLYKEKLYNKTSYNKTSYNKTSYNKTSYNETSYNETYYNEKYYNETSYKKQIGRVILYKTVDPLFLCFAIGGLFIFSRFTTERVVYPVML